MTVEQLINELGQYDPDAEVRIYPEGLAVPREGFEVRSVVEADIAEDDEHPETAVLICDEDEI